MYLTCVKEKNGFRHSLQTTEQKILFVQSLYFFLRHHTWFAAYLVFRDLIIVTVQKYKLFF